MSSFTSLGIVIVSMLIIAFCQLEQSVLAIFYHASLMKKPLKRVDDSCLSFIFGVELAISAIFLGTFFVISLVSANFDLIHSVFVWIMGGIFAAEAVAVAGFYFRRGKKYKASTELFISRGMAESFIDKAEHIKSRTDAIALGFVSVIPELIFTFPLYVASSLAILNITTYACGLYIIGFVLAATVPLFIVRTFFHSGRNLAELQRLRVKLRPHFRFILSAGYLLLALIMFYMGIKNGF